MSTDTDPTVTLRQVLEQIPELRQMRFDSQESTEWKRDVRIAIERVFGDNSGHVQEFISIQWSPSGISFNREVAETLHWTAYLRALGNAEALLNSMVREIETPDLNNGTSASSSVSMVEEEAPNASQVFVIHGRNDGIKNTVARFIEGLGLEPIILHEQPDEGRTIIEKFEDYADQVGYAVALCTGDDVGALAGDEKTLRPRTRQNVIFELGFFNGKIGRNRACALIEEGVEMPSDYNGIIYIQMNDQEGWKLPLFRRLRGAGLNVDANDII